MRPIDRIGYSYLIYEMKRDDLGLYQQHLAAVSVVSGNIEQ